MTNADTQVPYWEEKITFEKHETNLIKQLLIYDPVMGTQLGLPGDHDSQLPLVEQTARTGLIADIQKSVASLRELGKPWLINDNEIDAELAVAGVRGMEIFDSALRPLEHNPDWYLESAMTSIHSLLMRIDMPLDEKIDHLYSRLNRIPTYLQAGRDQITRPSRVLVENAAGDAEGAMAFCQDSLRGFIASIPDQNAQRKLEEARQPCLNAIQDFGSFIETLKDRSTEDFAMGKSAYNALLKETHKIRYDSDGLLALGYRVAEEIERELRELSQRAAGQSQWWVTLEPLSKYHPTRESLLEEYRRTLDEAKQFVKEHNLVDLSNTNPLELQPTPTFARTNLPFAAYVSVPPFAKSGRAQFWVTPVTDDLPADRAESALRGHHIGRILVACVHEAYPGHHVQFSHASSVHRPFRHIFASTVFLEGWALYCEQLMRRAAFKHDDPHFDLLQMSQLRDQLWRALRIVLDVGLHCNGMTKAEATDLLVEKHILDRDSAAAEVMYYCSAPTQPMSYMVGKLLVEEIVKRCQDMGGERFRSLFDIHNQLLAHGPLPFALLEHAMGVG